MCFLYLGANWWGAATSWQLLPVSLTDVVAARLTNYQIDWPSSCHAGVIEGTVATIWVLHIA